jgi:hypothetical protein
VYGVYCSADKAEPQMFYEEMAELTGGVFLRLANFTFVNEMFMAICYREANMDHDNLHAYEAEVQRRSSGEMAAGLKQMFRTLSKTNLEQTKVLFV